MAKRVKEKKEKVNCSVGFMIFRDIHSLIIKKYPNATVGAMNEALAWEILEQDAATRKFHKGVDTEDIKSSLDRVVMGRKENSDTNTLVRVCAIASALIAQYEETQKKKAEEHKENCDCEDCAKEEVKE